jgi:hypothetical protein
MIFVFVIDTSPSMSFPVTAAASGTTNSMSRLDVGKMAVESVARRLYKTYGAQDSLLLLSTSRQRSDAALCAVGGRLLVGFNNAIYNSSSDHSPTRLEEQRSAASATTETHLQLEHWESFQRELKGLKASDDGGGAVGLNASLSAGLQLLSRYRLCNPLTEHFGMGRLTNAAQALQPACLLLVTDGACLRQPPHLGGGSLQLQFGSLPLREFYKEPFRWDQRIFCLAVGDAADSNQYLHPQLRALVEVTGGSHWMVRSPLKLPTDAMLKRIRPLSTRELPIQDPLFAKLFPPVAYHGTSAATTHTMLPGASFVNGGPVCCFQAFEGDESGRPSQQRRAMLLYTASHATTTMVSPPPQQGGGHPKPVLSQPLWCIPESFFPSAKLDALPPRAAQPVLFYSKYPANLGSKSFEPMQVIKMLHRLDQLTIANRKALQQPARSCLHRDVYICEWLAPDGSKPIQLSISSHNEYFPVFCRDAGRPTLSIDNDSFLNIGILHAPLNSSTLASQSGHSRLATLTLLPPEPHILLPLLLRAAEAEHRLLKKAADANHPIHKLNVSLDENWRTEFRAYLFRLPPYYQNSLKRGLRTVLPASAHSLLPTDGIDSVALQCFSKVCLQKIRNGELLAKDSNERLERQESSLRRQNAMIEHPPRNEKIASIRYGQFDPRSSVDSYLAALRNMPPPWHVPGLAVPSKEEKKVQELKSDTNSIVSEINTESPVSVVDVLGDLPAECLMAYYESRRRWLFGGPSLTTKGLHVEGVNNGGTNSQRCGSKSSDRDECLLSMAGVGVSVLNETTTTRMGDYRERLLFSRSPVVGYGSNDAAGVSATTAIDGSPCWSVDDDAMPTTFFDPISGEFADSVQARVRSRLMVNFGNPYKEKRADSFLPEKYLSQAPSMQQGGIKFVDGSPRTPTGSPPQDSFDSVEEGEAIFVRKSPSRVSPKREEPDEPVPDTAAKRPRTESMDERESVTGAGREVVSANNKHAAQPPKPNPTTIPRPPIKSGSVPPPPKPSAAPPTSTNMPTASSSAPSQARQAPPPPKHLGQLKPTLGASRPPPPPPPVSGKDVGTVKPPVGPPKPPPPRLAEASPLATSPGTARNLKALPMIAAPPLLSTTAEPLTSGAKDTSPQLQSTPVTDADLENPNEKPNVDLPLGWICVWSKSQKRWYFFDTKTSKSVWKWPP